MLFVPLFTIRLLRHTWKSQIQIAFPLISMWSCHHSWIITQPATTIPLHIWQRPRTRIFVNGTTVVVGDPKTDTLDTFLGAGKQIAGIR